ncbi:MAG: HAD family hydrolase [Chloroflexi bacterium]|nr:HAD family hydrolase [Chloroflexota bacterium]
MPVKVVIFDVYNTLFRNDTSSWMGTFRDICRTQELPVSPEELWTCWKPIEVRFRQSRTNMEQPEKSPPFKTYQAAWREAFLEAFQRLGIRGDADQAAQMSVDSLSTRPPYDDTLPALEYIALRWKRALLTNADNGSILPLLQRNRLSFDTVLTSEMLRAYKPDPRAFRSILEKSGISAENALYVGDTLFDDVHGAKLAGMSVVWINRNGADPDHNLLPPDYQIAELGQLIDILHSLDEVSP